MVLEKKLYWSEAKGLPLQYAIQQSDAPEDLEWDEFVVNTPGGHHVQTSAWGRVKASMGWRAWRVIVRENGQIMAGAQILLRPLPLVGCVAYITKGPVCIREDKVLIDFILSFVQALCDEQHCQLLAVQPPNNGSYIEEVLQARSFRNSTLELAPIATLMIDLSVGSEAVFKKMHHVHRKSIRHAERVGVIVREGNQSELDEFYSLYLGTAERQGFTPFPRSYFDSLWEQLAPQGWIALMLGWFEGEAVSGGILIPFGDTVIMKMAGWSGKHSNHHINEALAWACFQWALNHGYHYVDYEGMDPQSVIDIQAGKSVENKPDSFKYRFGGQAMMLPRAYDLVPNPVINWVYRKLPPPRVGGTTLMSKVLELIRKR